MLLNFLKYENLKFLKSYIFIPPIFIYLLCLISIYIYKDVPVLSSYGSTSIVLFLIMTWLTIINFKHDTINERYILYIQLRSKNNYLKLKVLYLFLVSCLLILLSLSYPLLIHVFNKDVTLNLISIGLITHILMGLFGILLGSFVTNTKIASKNFNWLLTILIIIVTLTKDLLIEQFSFLQWILWTLPPISSILYLLNKDSIHIFNLDFIMLCIHSFIYIVIFFQMINYFFNRQ